LTHVGKQCWTKKLASGVQTGVAQSELEIENGKRAVASIQDILTGNGLELASANEYQSWLHQRLRT
ncbi:MAG: hypothetical protein GY809_07715, partial [Planctomycetes bacterium]|nr:hypothetical protein [Planctomycetota bacterium]